MTSTSTNIDYDETQLALFGMREEDDRSKFRKAISGIRNFATGYPLGMVGAVVMVLLVAMAIIPQLFTPLAVQKASSIIGIHISDRFETPNIHFWFGTNALGRDMYGRLIYGARTAIMIGFGAVILAKLLSTVIGTVSAFFGGWVDVVLQRIVEMVQSIPTLVFLILFVVMLEPRLPDIGPLSSDMLVILLVVAVHSGFTSSRTVRGVAISLRQETYVEAAQALGASDSRIMVRHIVPNLIAYVIVSASLFVGAAVLLESSLSFLGYGVQPPAPSWGRELNEAREELARYPHLAFFPGLFIFATVWSFNMFGDALRDRLDPRLRGST
ncbi:MAG TPA: ABC transporter permease [Dehalococcoidia bacterium]|jgi:ABC-type dipeptide/oligopeptide/nickel transport system permease subunit|nr:ABC transporter permease [Dehalococcoidia bacterium]